MSSTYSITTFSLTCPTTMIQPLHKHSPSKTLILLATCVGFFGVVLIANYFWASSSSSSSLVYSSIASNSARERSKIVLYPADGAVKKLNVTKKNQEPNRFLSPTFADIPAPELKWEAMPPAPVPRLDGSSIHIKDLLYVISGYGSLDHVHSHVDVYNFTSNTWGRRLDAPKEMAHSHLGVASDGRFIYVVSGQYGPQCSGPVSLSFVLDTVTKKWKKMPPLPVPRYAPATQIWRGRLHVMGGSKGNRHTPGVEHWSIAVRDGKALEKEWRTEVPIPRGGPHRACIVVDDRLYVIGGQEGDFMAKPGSPIFKCSRRKEVIYGDVYMLDGGMKWTSLPPMPKPNSHIEFSWIVLNKSIVITGGTSENHPVNKRMTLVGEVFRFDVDTMKWSVIGRLPYRVKTALAAYWDGWLYFTSGQRDRGPDNPQPKQVVGDMWRTPLHL